MSNKVQTTGRESMRFSSAVWESCLRYEIWTACKSFSWVNIILLGLCKSLREAFACSIIQWNFWITDIVGPCWSVCNKVVFFIRRVHPVIWRTFPVAVCHVTETWALLDCRQALKHCRMDRNDYYLQEQQTFFNYFTLVSWDCPLLEGNLYRFCPLGRDYSVCNSE